jgi:hypothetical protein
MTTLKRLSATAVGAGLVYVMSLSPSNPNAQGAISVTFPTTLAAGPDYATDVLGDPWDMCNREDVAMRPDEIVGFSSFSFVQGPCRAGGTTMAVNGTADSNFMMLSPGLYDVALNPGRNGRNFPIDTSKYQVLSFKLNSNVTDDPQIHWFHNTYNDPSGPGFGGRGALRTNPGTQLTIADLTQSLIIPSYSPWTNGVVRGLRIDPNASNAIENVFFYWVRLTPAASSPLAAKQAITWTGSGATTITVRDNSDGAVFPVTSNLSSNSYLWNYGVLAPGSYTLTVTNGSGSGSATFTINNPPTIEVTNPSSTSGDDYATTVLGNPWDMSSGADIQLTGLANLTNVSFTGGLLNATNTNNDPIVMLLYNSNNSVPIDTSRFRYFTYRLQVDGPYDLGAGSVARVFWSSQVSNPVAISQDIIVFPGMNTYTVDLASLSTAPDGGLEPSGAGETWTSAPKRYLRLDPHEFPTARTFHVDDVKLTAKPVGTTSFTIRFLAGDRDASATTVSLYYDADTNPGNGKTLIASGIPGSAGQFVWNTGGMPRGEYYVYAEASDGVQVMGRYSAVPLQLIGAPPAPTGLRFVPR